MPPSNDFEKLFCNRVEELKTLICSTNEYDRLKISATLRPLLLEDLMHQANRRLQMSIRFPIAYHSLPMNPNAVWSIIDGLYPSPDDGYPIMRQTLKQFIAQPILKTDKETVTVRDIIKFEAHVKGGVHVRNPENSKEKSLDNQLFRIVERDGKEMRVSLRQLVTIGKIVLEALTPLYNAIQKS